MINSDAVRKTIHNYEHIAGLYAEDFGDDMEHFDFIGQAVALVRNRQLTGYPFLDLGSGPGNVVKYLLDRKVSNIIAVDFTPAFIRILKDRFGDSVTIVRDDMTGYLAERESSSAACIIASYSIIHIPINELKTLFSDISRTLVKGGVFVLACHKGTEAVFEPDPYQVNKDKRLKTEEKLESFIKYFTEEELRSYTADAGLSVIRMETFDPTIVSGEIPVPKIWLLAEKP